ncbi:hypothetical protein DFJ77DRAFT_321866 [Powellomyces hirtus]|nr:hypothetical protein DFJ77DRAFT_321866 [Powellomyces hirtus]
MSVASSPPSENKQPLTTPEPPKKSIGPLPHFFQVLNLENDDNARTLVGVFQEQIGLAEEIVKCREELTEAEEALGKVEQARKEFAQERKRDEKKLDDKTRQALKKEKKNAERAARKRGFPVSGGLTVTSTNVLTFVEAQASLASVSGPKDICRVVEVIKNEGTLVSDTGRYFHTGPIRNETTFQLLCGLAFREVADAREKVTALEKRSKDLDSMADKGHLALMDSVRKRYKVLAIRMHPDKLPRAPTEEDYKRFRELQTAHQVLSDTELRRRYIQMMDHNAFLATLPKSSKDADQEGQRPVIKRDNHSSVPQPTRTVHPNDHRRLTGGFPHQCTMPRVIDTILNDPKRGHSRVMLSWSCASAEELQISRYELHVKQRSIGPEASDWVRIYLGWSTEWWTDVLPPGHYSFRVRAENNLGLGEWSTFLDHYVEDIQAVRQQRREEYERNKEERRVKMAKRLRGQISQVLNQTGNIPTTEKLSKLRKLLEQARRSRMEEVIVETEEIVLEMEARVAKNEEQHLWKSKLNEFIKVALKEDGNGRISKEEEVAAPHEEAADGDEDDDLEHEGHEKQHQSVSPLKDETNGSESSQKSPEESQLGVGSPSLPDTSSDFEDFLASLPSMYPPDTPYILPATIRNQIVQNVQALIRNRPPLDVLSVVPDTNEPSDISISISHELVYNRIIAICRAALVQKEYLGGQAGFREIDVATRVLAREIEDAARAMDKKRHQIELFLKERDRGMKARAEADRIARERASRSAGPTMEREVSNQPHEVEADKSVVAETDDEAHHQKHMEEPPPPYTPREYDDSGLEIDPDDDGNNNFEYVGTPRLRRRGTRGGARKRKESDIGSVTSITALSSSSVTAAQSPQAFSSPQQPVISPGAARRGTSNRVRNQETAAAISPESRGNNKSAPDDFAAHTEPISTTHSSPSPKATSVQFGNIELHSNGMEEDTTTSSRTSSVSEPLQDGRLFRFLSSLGLEQHFENFEAQDVTYSDLRYLREWDLVQLGITKVGPRKRLMHLIHEEATNHPVASSDFSQVAENLAQWLGQQGLGIYVDAFSKEEVAFDDLKALTEDDLVNTFGIEKIGHLARILSAISDLKSAKTAGGSASIPLSVHQGTTAAKVDEGEPADVASTATKDGEAEGPTEVLAESTHTAYLDEEPNSEPVEPDGKVSATPTSGLNIPYPFADQMGNIRSVVYPGAAAIAADTYGGLNTQGVSTWGERGVETGGWNQQVEAGDYPSLESYQFSSTPYSTYPGAAGRTGRAAHQGVPAAFDTVTPAATNAYGLHGAALYRQQQHTQQQSHQQHLYQQQQQPHGLAQHHLLQSIPAAARGYSRQDVTGAPPSQHFLAPEMNGIPAVMPSHGIHPSSIPAEFICALTRRVMTIPVRGPDGYYYDHAPLRARLIADNSWRSPITLMYHPVESWHRALNNPDLALKSVIDTWVMKARRRGSVGALNAARDLWGGTSTDGTGTSTLNGTTGAASTSSAGSGGSGNTAIPSIAGLKGDTTLSVPPASQGLKATMGLSGWTADVPGGASIWR